MAGAGAACPPSPWGLAGGFLQGFAITRLKVPPFVVTLGGMSAFRGAALLFAAGGPISGFPPDYTWWGQGRIGASARSGDHLPCLRAYRSHRAALHALREALYAVGGNPEAARLSGLNVQRVTLSVYVIMGFFAGLGAFVLSARLNSAEAVAGTGYELTVIASVVIGGTSLFGGVGTIFGTVIGSILIGVLLNGLVLMNVSSYIQQIIIGVIIVLAVAFDTLPSRGGDAPRAPKDRRDYVGSSFCGFSVIAPQQRRNLADQEQSRVDPLAGKFSDLPGSSLGRRWKPSVAALARRSPQAIPAALVGSQHVAGDGAASR
jgi:hypothetical protein